MAVPRIIIAETNEKIAFPMQNIFVNEFFDKLKLEIITDSEYFKNLFMKPQTADILIISDELYDSNIQRHNISHIFVMTEEEEQCEFGNSRILKLYKYTATGVLFKEIAAKSADVLPGDQQVKQETQVVVVTSACGGVGKTTLAMGISACLTKDYKKVLYVNAGRLQSFQFMLNDHTPIISSDVYVYLSNPDVNVYQNIKHTIRNELFGYLPPFKASITSLNLDFSIYEKIVKSAKKTKDYDVIIVDMDSAFDNYQTSFITMADKVVIVTTQSKASVYATNILMKNMSISEKEKYLFVCNKTDNSIVNATKDTIKLEFGVNNYVSMIPDIDSLQLSSIANDSDIRKLSSLIAY